MNLTDYFEGLDWTDEAECKSTRPNIWFPDGPGSPGSRLAKQVCGMCSVRSECLEYALATKQEDGIWGGLAPKERERLRKQRQKALRQFELGYQH